MNYQEKIDELTEHFCDISKPIFDSKEVREKLEKYETLYFLYYKLTYVLFSAKFQETINEEEFNEIEKCVDKVISQLILFYMENNIKIDGVEEKDELKKGKKKKKKKNLAEKI
jgi:hypothetical protein